MKKAIAAGTILLIAWLVQGAHGAETQEPATISLAELMEALSHLPEEEEGPTPSTYDIMLAGGEMTQPRRFVCKCERTGTAASLSLYSVPAPSPEKPTEEPKPVSILRVIKDTATGRIQLVNHQRRIIGLYPEGVTELLLSQSKQDLRELFARYENEPSAVDVKRFPDNSMEVRIKKIIRLSQELYGVLRVLLSPELEFRGAMVTYKLQRQIGHMSRETAAARYQVTISKRTQDHADEDLPAIHEEHNDAYTRYLVGLGEIEE